MTYQLPCLSQKVTTPLSISVLGHLLPLAFCSQDFISFHSIKSYWTRGKNTLSCSYLSVCSYRGLVEITGQRLCSRCIYHQLRASFFTVQNPPKKNSSIKLDGAAQLLSNVSFILDTLALLKVSTVKTELAASQLHKFTSQSWPKLNSWIHWSQWLLWNE